MTPTIERPAARASRNALRITEELCIEIPALPSPKLGELRKRAKWIQSIERNTATTKAIALTLGTTLRPKERSVSGLECDRRLQSQLDIILGYQQAWWLMENQKEFPELMALLGEIYIDFSGLIVISKDGFRRQPYLNREMDCWGLRWVLVELPNGQKGRVALGKFDRAA